MRWRALLLTGSALLLAAGSARAQLPSAQSWATLESAHFRVTYTRDLEPVARHAAAAAERARAALVDYVGRAPGGRVDIVLSDNVDVSNGSATPFPDNRIYLYAKPPVDVAELNYVHDWIELVVAHELAHIFHLDATSGAGRLLRTLFGRVPFSWPFFPAVGSPRWAVEGLAVAVESALTPLGRAHGTYHEMVARTAALESGIEDLDRLSSESPLWPGGQRVYIYGALLFEELEQRYGAEALRRVVARTTGAWLPPALWFDRVGTQALGVNFRTAYAQWRSEATARYLAHAGLLRAQGLTSSETLAAHGGIAARPRFSPDGSTLAYTAADRRSAPVVRVIDAASGRQLRTHQTSGTAGASWFPDGTLLVPMLEFVDPEHVFYDLHHLARGGDRRLTSGARLQDVDVAPDGARTIAVQNDAGTNRLVAVDAEGRLLRPLTPFDPDIHWSAPRWAPGGERIAVSRWSTGGRFDVVILDTLGAVLREVTDGVGVNADPAWTPDGRFLLFSSDRTGVANLYAFDLESDSLRQVTNVLTGAFSPDVSPDGRTIAFSAYHADGHHIERMPFEPAAWRLPQTARLPQLPLPAPARARAHADTLAGPVLPYRAGSSALPRFWMPVWLGGGAGDFVGAGSFGWDLVERHRWSASLAFDPHDGRSAGAFAWEYRGLPPLGSLKPVLRLSADRDWDRALLGADESEPFLDEREDVLGASLALQRTHWRSLASLSIGGELVRRTRHLHDRSELRLLDDRDDLLGARASFSFANARVHPFSISPENGVRLQLAARERHDRSPASFTDSAGVTRALDGSYREFTAWGAAYRTLGRTAFASTVLALRGSALHRDGPGASTHGVGGTSGSGIPGFELVDTGSEFLPVRGFPAGERRGTRAWSATAELRVPLLMVARRPRFLPFFVHSLSSALFLDAGAATCPAGLACGPRATGPTLLAAGGELALDASLLAAHATLRAGLAFPLQGGATREPRALLQLGHAF